MKIKSKINLIDNLKMKYDVKGREIMNKTRIITRDSTRSDPIDHRIKGFLFPDFEDDHRHSRSDFSLFSSQTLTFKHSLKREIDLEDEEIKRFKD